MIPEDAVSVAEVEEVLAELRRARRDLASIQRASGGSRELRACILKLDEVVGRLTRV